MRKKMVAGNWKMHSSRDEAYALVETIKQGADTCMDVDIVVIPSFVHLQTIENSLASSRITWGAQNMYPGQSGAFTGEVSGPMLVDYGCDYVLVGHSERRHVFHEGLDLVAEKFKAALQCGLRPILCVGETIDQREKGETRDILTQQVMSVINLVGIEAFDTAIIAYEPVWAIGTGLTATPLQAQEMHEYIRDELTNFHPDIANHTRILYGGSMKADNAAGLFAMPDIDGGLVGGASLDAKSFLAICRAACVVYEA